MTRHEMWTSANTLADTTSLSNAHFFLKHKEYYLLTSDYRLFQDTTPCLHYQHVFSINIPHDTENPNQVEIAAAAEYRMSSDMWAAQNNGYVTGYLTFKRNSDSVS